MLKDGVVLDLSKLPWLKQSPVRLQDFLETAHEESCEDLRFNLFKLSSHALNPTQLQIFSRKAQGFSSRLEGLFTPVRIAILGNTTTHYIAKGIEATGFRYKLHVKTFETEFNQIQQTIFDTNSSLYAYKPDVIVFNIDWRGLPLCMGYNNLIENGEELLEQSIHYIQTLIQTVQSHCNASIILQTLAPLPLQVFGHFDASSHHGLKYAIMRFNAFILGLQTQSGLYVMDLENLASMVGLVRWHDPNHWFLAKLPFSHDLLPLYCDHVCRVISSIKNTARKVLVMDLDNTLWGGIIGDDGLHGIKMGAGDSIGEAFSEVQTMAKALKTRGVVLAVCSKNTKEIALSPFQKHPEMRLKEEDVSIFQANWIDKAANIQYIARALNLGLDSLVFMDDNPAERERIRQELPEVAVLEMGNDPSYYPFILSNCGYFETFHLSDEDLKRSEYYKNNIRRDEVRANASSVEHYLQSLAMKITFSSFDKLNRQRILQLINKSNQYNLTTKRYTEQELAKIEDHADYFCLQVRLDDRFGDNGMISVVICKKDETNKKVWEIDTWLMSCRVLGRKVEFAVLNEIMRQARHLNIETIRGVYRPTPKNGLVEDHYENLGFEKESSSLKENTWIIPVTNYQDFIVPISHTQDEISFSKRSIG